MSKEALKTAILAALDAAPEAWEPGKEIVAAQRDGTLVIVARGDFRDDLAEFLHSERDPEGNPVMIENAP